MTNIVALPERYPGFVPERLIQARVARQLSRRELAELAGVTGQSIAYYEVGERRPDMRMVLKFSESLWRSPSFFLTPTPLIKEVETRFFRAVGKRTNRMNDSLEVRVKWLCEIISFISQKVRLPTVNLPQFPPPAARETYLPTEVEDIAQLTRRHWGLGDGPIANMVALLETFGVITTRFSFGSTRIDAFSCWISGRPYIVLGSDKKSAARSRFDAAHELGHLILHRDISQEDIHSKSTLDRIEAEANRFAGAFLLPRDSLLSEFYSTRMNHLEGLKKRWRVSMQAIAHRAKDVGAIDEYQYINFRKQISAQKMLTVEPLDDVLPIEQPRLIMKAWKIITDMAKPERLPETDLGLGSDLIEEVCGLSLDPQPPPAEPQLRQLN
jgi:Zn-dependent peptidase ImmA (M78 family)/transcriptional regulator with XRE-family HTH domain